MPRSLLLVLVVALLAPACGGRGHPSARRAGSTTSSTTTAEPPVTTLEATRAPWSLPQPLSRQAAIVADGGITVAGGLTTGDQTTGASYRIDPATGRVTALPALVSPAHDCAGAVIDGRPLVLGGGRQTESSDVQTIGAGSAVVGHLPTARADLATITSGSTTYVVGGYDGHTAFADVLATNDGVRFETAGRLPIAVRYPAVAITGTTLWVFGGEIATGDTDAIQSLDLRSGSAAVVGHLAAPVGHASAFVLHGSVWVVGGRAGGAPSANIRRFDTSTHAVTVTGQLPTAVRDAAVVVVGSTAYLLGGQSPDPSRDVVMLR